mmetsp:Transcript_66824/g.59931  ORF Transcript_66824/g.59931 Transcript_66824/m.59931 type:complete len:253 (+) Transcript_66824:203-961(+)
MTSSLPLSNIKSFLSLSSCFCSSSLSMVPFGVIISSSLSPIISISFSISKSKSISLVSGTSSCGPPDSNPIPICILVTNSTSLPSVCVGDVVPVPTIGKIEFEFIPTNANLLIGLLGLDNLYKINVTPNIHKIATAIITMTNVDNVFFPPLLSLFTSLVVMSLFSPELKIPVVDVCDGDTVELAVLVGCTDGLLVGADEGLDVGSIVTSDIDGGNGDMEGCEEGDVDGSFDVCDGDEGCSVGVLVAIGDIVG